MKPFQSLHKWLQTASYEAILVTKPENIGYLTGFWGSFGAYLQTLSGERVLLTDGRYQAVATALAAKSGFKFELFKGGVPTEFVDLVSQSLIVEDTLTLAQFEKYQQWFAGVRLNSQPAVIENLRRVKTTSERQIMQEAQAHVDSILVDFIKVNVKRGITEQQLKFKLDQALQAEGRYGLSFDSIIGFGPGSALPHYQSGDRPLKHGDNILVDCGVIDRHYCSDMTRNFVFGSADKNYEKDYDTLLQNQVKALSGVRSGVETKALDLQCREGLGDLADLFIHSLGHGVGLEIHEAPTLSVRSQDVLQTNEVVTIEPGIYKAGKYGIRIEDSAIVQQHGSEVLTKTTKDLLSFDEAGKVRTLVKAA